MVRPDAPNVSNIDVLTFTFTEHLSQILRCGPLPVTVATRIINYIFSRGSRTKPLFAAASARWEPTIVINGTATP